MLQPAPEHPPKNPARGKHRLPKFSAEQKRPVSRKTGDVRKVHFPKIGKQKKEHIMCEYCDSMNPQPIKLQEKDNGFCVYILIMDANGNANVPFMDVSIDYSGHELGVELSEQIHYCPMCGRKLAEDES